MRRSRSTASASDAEPITAATPRRAGDGSRRSVPRELDVGDDGAAEVRDARPAPVVRGFSPARGGRGRSLARRCLHEPAPGTVRLRDLDRARHTDGARYAHGGDAALRRGQRVGAHRTGAGHRARGGLHAVRHAPQLAGPRRVRLHQSARALHRRGDGPVRVCGGVQERTGCAVLQFYGSNETAC